LHLQSKQFICEEIAALSFLHCHCLRLLKLLLKVRKDAHQPFELINLFARMHISSEHRRHEEIRMSSKGPHLVW
jgi:hypothetical protein